MVNVAYTMSRALPAVLSPSLASLAASPLWVGLFFAGGCFTDLGVTSSAGGAGDPTSGAEPATTDKPTTTGGTTADTTSVTPTEDVSGTTTGTSGTTTAATGVPDDTGTA